MIHKNITVVGMVQGVGFRYSARKTATACGINGYVKNLSNGSVYIEAEGNQNDMNQFLEWCYHGPAYAVVERLKITDGQLKNFSIFEIWV